MSQQINLFNPAYSRPRKTLSALSMLQALGLIVTVTLIVTASMPVLFFNLERQARDASAAREAVEVRLLKLRKEDVVIAQSSTLDDGIKDVNSDISTMKKLISVLGTDLRSDTASYSSYLQAFARNRVDGLWLTGLSVAGTGHDMTLQGKALQPELVATYLANLKKVPIFKGVAFSALDIVAGKTAGYVEFDLRSPGLEKTSATARQPASVPISRTGNTTGAKP